MAKSLLPKQHMSNRRDKPFVKVNCAAIPETTLEEGVFGHERALLQARISKSRKI